MFRWIIMVMKKIIVIDTQRLNEKRLMVNVITSLIKKNYQVLQLSWTTQSAEKREALAQWRASKGEAEATRIVDESGARGTAMHKILEKYILEEGYLDETAVGKQAHNMAIQVIQSGLSNVTEYYGTECTLYYPGLYAGQTDLVGIHKGQDAIIDFKQTNKPKKREWIDDYFLQLSAYAMAHNILFNTQITKGVIMMCSKDNYYQEFVVEGSEFQKYKHNFLRRVDEYYKSRNEED